MLTSATGARAAAERGFTLVEMMVALAVMGLATGAVLMNLPADGPRLSDEAERLAARLEHAREEALSTNRPVEVALTPAGYAFRVQRRGVWTPLEEGPFKAQAWPQGLSVTARNADGRSAVRFDTTGSADAAVISLSSNERTVRVAVDEQGGVRVDAGAR